MFRVVAAKRPIFLTYLSLSLFWGAAVSSPYWFTVFQMRPHVALERATEGYFVAGNHVVYLPQLFSPTWEFGTSVPGPGDTMPFTLGLPHFLLALVGAWLGRRDRIMNVALAAYVILIALMLPLSAGLWNAIDLLRLVQFPWRLLAVIATVQLILSLGCAKRPAWLLGVCVLIIAVTGYRQFSIKWTSVSIQAASQLAEEEARNASNGFLKYAVSGEFDPKR
jgi:hypothetical protein